MTDISASALGTLVRRARRRYVFQVVLEQTAFAATVATGGTVALLLFGTSIFNGYWLAAIFGASLAWGLYRARTRFLDRYRLTQRIDQRLGLHDALSTALFFSTHPKQTLTPASVVEIQRQEAERVAADADVALALPYAFPKPLYAGSVLALVALSVFAVRFGITRSLDLRPSLVQMAYNGLLDSVQAADARRPGQHGSLPGEKPREDALGVDPWETKALDAQGPSNDALNSTETPDPNNPTYNTDPNQKPAGTPAQDPVQEPNQPSDEGGKSANGSAQENEAGDQNKQGSKAGKQGGADQNDKSGNNSNENSSLADKMRDALSNLMSKLKQNQESGDKKQSPQSGSQQSQQQAKQQEKGEKGSPQAGKQQDAMSSPDQQGDQEGQNSDKATSAQNKSGSKSADRKPSNDGKSGIGKEDGDKAAREAEQLAAMGKITELLGKRAQNMTGEVMVEVSSGKQQLKTQYTQQKAAHVDAGGEIHRDEVPLAYQKVVQQYFEEIRKAPAAATQSKGK